MEETAKNAALEIADIVANYSARIGRDVSRWRLTKKVVRHLSGWPTLTPERMQALHTACLDLDIVMFEASDTLLGFLQIKKADSWIKLGPTSDETAEQ